MTNLNFYKYIDEKSILVITPSGILKRLYCPFSVTYNTSKSNLHSQKLFVVDKIAMGIDNKIYYYINDCYRSHSNYKILIRR